MMTVDGGQWVGVGKIKDKRQVVTKKDEGRIRRIRRQWQEAVCRRSGWVGTSPTEAVIGAGVR